MLPTNRPTDRRIKQTGIKWQKWKTRDDENETKKKKDKHARGEKKKEEAHLRGE